MLNTPVTQTTHLETPGPPHLSGMCAVIKSPWPLHAGWLLKRTRGQGRDSPSPFLPKTHQCGKLFPFKPHQSGKLFPFKPPTYLLLSLF